MAHDVAAQVGPLADPAARQREHRRWYVYDWANSAFSTSVITVFSGPYLNGVAANVADASGDVPLLWFDVAANSYFPFAVSLSVIAQALTLPLVGAAADRSPDKRRLLQGLVTVGALATVALFVVTGDRLQLGALCLLVANVAFGAAAVVYESFLPEIALPDERDGVSSRGWAAGYAGGGLLLAAHLVLFLFAEDLGLSENLAARIAMASAGVWWFAFSQVTIRGLVRRPPLVDSAGETEGVVAGAGASLRELWGTVRELRHTPRTLVFLAAFLLYNDGVATVITAAGIFATDELDIDLTTLTAAILLVQFVAVFGALALGRIAEWIGAKRTILGSLVLWTTVVALGRTVAPGDVSAFFLLAASIGFVLGGTQALSRSLFSQLVPTGEEAQFFALYQLSDRGTSWLGTLALGIAVSVTGSYRDGILVLLFFFVSGGLLLAVTDVRRAIREAGNEVPEVV
ncbi:MAG: MFS transporter [Gammaproteobacteria bacterium]|nr:MFS transporter [Gammaproteobacteria bacterium]